jgi:hypothetical protein
VLFAALRQWAPLLSTPHFSQSLQADSLALLLDCKILGVNLVGDKAQKSDHAHKRNQRTTQ